MHQGAAQRDLQFLAARKTLGQAIGEFRHAETLDQIVDVGFQFRAAGAVQLPEIAYVFARRQPRIEAAHIGQHAQLALRRHTVVRHIDAIDPRDACVRHQQPVDDAERRGLARTVGSDQAGDLSIRRGEAQSVQGQDFIEVLGEGFDLNHG